MYSEPITEDDFPTYTQILDSSTQSNAPQCIWYLPSKAKSCMVSVSRIEDEEISRLKDLDSRLTKDTLSQELQRLEQVAEFRCCKEMHRSKPRGTGLGRKLAMRWMVEIIMRSSVPGSLELLEQLAAMKESSPVSGSVVFETHKVFEQKVMATVLDDRIGHEEGKFGSVYIYIHNQDAFNGLIKIGSTTITVESRLKRWSKCGHGDPVHLRTYEKIRRPQRVERLTHIELADHRHERWCKVHDRCHIEWFKIDVESAEPIIKHWSLWMATDPYNSQGRLEKFWVNAIKILTKHQSPITGEIVLQIHHIRKDVEFLIKHRKRTREEAIEEIHQLARRCPSLEDFCFSLAEIFTICMGFFRLCGNGTGEFAIEKDKARTRLRSISCFCGQNSGCPRLRHEEPTLEASRNAIQR